MKRQQPSTLRLSLFFLLPCFFSFFLGSCRVCSVFGRVCESTLSATPSVSISNDPLSATTSNMCLTVPNQFVSFFVTLLLLFFFSCTLVSFSFRVWPCCGLVLLFFLQTFSHRKQNKVHRSRYRAQKDHLSQVHLLPRSPCFFLPFFRSFFVCGPARWLVLSLLPSCSGLRPLHATSQKVHAASEVPHIAVQTAKHTDRMSVCMCALVSE